MGARATFRCTSINRLANYKPTLSSQELCKNPAAAAFVLEKLKKMGSEHKLKGFEMVKAVHLEPHEWESGSEVMTPSYKLVRNKLQKHYQA